MASRITDKMRLDWLTALPEAHLHKMDGQWWFTVPSPAVGFKTPRRAIDAAIRAERKGRGKK